MKPLDSDEEDAEQLGARQKDRRQRANQNIQQHIPDGAETEEVRSSDGSHIMVMAEEDKASWSQKTQSEAVNQLKSLLLKQYRDVPASLSPSERLSPSKQEGRSNLPAFQDLVPMIQNQSEYIKHLEAEVKFCKEELHGMKQQVRVVENEKLLSELKSRAVDESLTDFTMQNSTVNETVDHKSSVVGLQRVEHNTWKNEQEQLEMIYKAQIESLKAQLIAARKDWSVCQKECEELKIRLVHKENMAAVKADGAPRVAGMCLKCAQHEAVLAETHTNLHVQAIDRLTKERDELLVALRAVRASHQDAQQREWSACLQVKQAVEIVEETNLQKARVEVQCEHLNRELTRLREQSDREAFALKERLTEARKKGYAEAHKQSEHLAHTVSHLTQRVAELEGQLDRTHRDNRSLTNQLEDAIRKLTNQERDNTKACVDLQYQISQSNLKKEEAERELRELKAKSSRDMETFAREVERLSSELVGCRKHLEAVQKDVSQWQAEALSLAEQLASVQRQLHLTRQDRESAAREHEEEAASLKLAAQERERELVTQLQQTEAQHQLRVGELDSLLGSQNSLIEKLREECCTLVAKLEELTGKNRSELEHLSLEKRHLERTVKSLRARCAEMEDQCVQHGRMHQRMKDRLQQLDRHCQSGAQQVCELLAKQNQLMQERNALSEEMQNLRVKLPSSRPANALPL